MTDRRRIAIARLTGIAAGWAQGTRRDLTREQALDQLRRISTDPDELAEATAQYVVRWTTPMPWDDQAAALLVEAGADPGRVEHWTAARRAVRRGFSLGAFAEGINRLPEAHG